MFEWDPAKDALNIEKHRIAFVEAVKIFAGPHYTYATERRGESRQVAIGWFAQRFLAVVYVDRVSGRRIISARRARDNEKQRWQETFGDPAVDER